MRDPEVAARRAHSRGRTAAGAAVDALIAAWGGCRLDIPNGSATRLRQRDHEIRRMYRNGTDLFALRDQFGLSDRHLRRIVSGVH